MYVCTFPIIIQTLLKFSNCVLLIVGPNRMCKSNGLVAYDSIGRLFSSGLPSSNIQYLAIIIFGCAIVVTTGVRNKMVFDLILCEKLLLVN